MLKARPGEIIRHRKTREPFLVIEKTAQGFLVVNLEMRIDPAAVQIILPRAQDNFEPDYEMVDMSKEEAEIIEEKLDFIDSVQETLFTDNG